MASSGKGIHHAIRKATPSVAIQRLKGKKSKDADDILKIRTSSGSLYRDSTGMNDKIGRIEGIDYQIQIIFKSEYIKLLIPHFERAGIGQAVLDGLINDYIKSGEKVSYEFWFLEYGQMVINPMLNKNLGRDVGHPTFNNLLRHALKEQLASDPTLQALSKFRAGDKKI